VWLIRAVVCLLAANRGSSCSLRRAMNGRIVRCGIISSCQSATTSKIVKALLAFSLFHVRSAIASAGLYLYLLHTGVECGVPALCSSARLVAQTGRSYLDLAVYRCNDNDSGSPMSVTGSVCQLDATWSTASSECVEQEDLVTPQLRPVAPH